VLTYVPELSAPHPFLIFGRSNNSRFGKTFALVCVKCSKFSLVRFHFVRDFPLHEIRSKFYESSQVFIHANITNAFNAVKISHAFNVSRARLYDGAYSRLSHRAAAVRNPSVAHIFEPTKILGSTLYP
tara:strand:- start:5366 stop:5749 length:384 start_codon:yes stop_codon:yes gene_type:complete